MPQQLENQSVFCDEKLSQQKLPSVQMQNWKQTVKLQLLKKKKELLFSSPDLVVSSIVWYDKVKCICVIVTFY